MSVLDPGSPHAGMPERPKGADCKSAGDRLRRFESFSRHCVCCPGRLRPVGPNRRRSALLRRWGPNTHGRVSWPGPTFGPLGGTDAGRRSSAGGAPTPPWPWLSVIASGGGHQPLRLESRRCASLAQWQSTSMVRRGSRVRIPEEARVHVSHAVAISSQSIAHSLGRNERRRRRRIESGRWAA